MTDAAGTVEKVALELAKLLAPLQRDLATPDGARAFLQQMGFALTPAQVTGLATQLANAAASTDAMSRTAQALISAIEAKDFGAIAAKSVEAVQRIATVIADLNVLGPPLGAVTGVPAATVARRLFDHLIFTYLQNTREVNDLLEIAGVLQRSEPIDADPPFTVATYDFGQFGTWLSRPGDQVKALYDWSKPTFDGRKLFEALERVLARAGLPVFFDDSGPVPRLDVFVFDAVPISGPEGTGLKIRLRSKMPASTIDFPAGPDASVSISLAGQIPAQTSLSLFPGGALAFAPPAGPLNGEFGLAVTAERTSPPAPFILFGQAGGSRLELGKFTASISTRVSWTGSEAVGTVKLEANADHLRLFVDATSGDGFLTKILPGTKFDADFSLAMGFSSANGLYFSGSSTLQIQLPLHLDLGPVDLNALTLNVGMADSKFPISAGVNIRAALGPLQAVVENIGVTALIEFVSGNQGNLGPVNVGIGFKPPNGVGLSLDAGVVKGGGFLFIDADRGEYAGALELALADIVTIKAIGIINTQMPDGSKGFSLLILMSVEFGTGIQLGFGFTLLAVGGLVGLNRTMKLDKLAEGIRSGAIESVMFPRDIIANAPRIISDLQTFFPPEEGKFLIGPMAKLGWGTPTLVSLSLGVIIEIPGNIAIVGILLISLPTVDAPLIKLQVNFIGAIEFDKKRIWFYASLYDSRVLFLTIDGRMGLLVAFGDDANFVVSVGGFHPRFLPPPLPFPSPTRFSMSILNTPVARIRVEGYFAVTSNTAQFGARVEVFFGLSALNVQGHLGFDALFQFSPFYFLIEISASLSVKAFGAGLFSVDLNGSLEGPAPWHIEGHGSISLLFFDIDVDFSETWGENRKEELTPISVLGLISDELAKAENWRAFLPNRTALYVSLRKMPEAEAALILHPVGSLRISQRAVPLDLTLDKVGSRKPVDVNRVELSVDGGGLARKADAFEQFAPAQFQNFKDADKLSRPAYAPEHSGLELSAAGQDMRSARMVRRIVRYEEIIIDSNYKRFARRFHLFAGSLFSLFLSANAASCLSISQARTRRLQPYDDQVAVLPDTYTVAHQATNAAYSAEAESFHSEASARDYMDRAIANDPGLAEQIHVIPAFERAA